MNFEQHKREFREQGFTIVPSALSEDDLDKLEQGMNEVVENHVSALPGQYLRESNLIEKHPNFWRLLDHPKVYPLVTQLLSPNPRIMSSEFIIRHGGSDDPVSWHDDGPACPSYRELATPAPLMQLKIGYFLTDCMTEDAGNLVVIPGSHLYEHSPPKDIPHGLEHPDAVAVKLRRGDALAFHNALWHCVQPCTRDEPRLNVWMGYCHSWMAPFDNSGASLFLRGALQGEQRRLLCAHDEPSTNWELVPKVFRGQPELAALGLAGRSRILLRRRLVKMKRRILGENLY